MRIGINLLYLIPNEAGGAKTYSTELLKGLALINRSDQFIIFVNRESKNLQIPLTSNFSRVVCPLTARNRAKRYIYEQLLFPKVLKKHKIDLVHSLGYVGPLLSPCPSVVSILDMNYFALEHDLTYFRRLFLRIFSTQTARKASRVITISEFSKSSICKFLRIGEMKVQVTHLGPKVNSKEKDSVDFAKIREQYRINGPYIVAFAGAKHKNINRLIEAFSKINMASSHKLVIIGRNHLPIEYLYSKSENLTNNIVFVGYIPENHIFPILRNAELFVMPSLYEGFGLPVVDAQMAGIAVACSSAGSLPEIAGKGATYFDPYSIDSIASSIQKCLIDNNFRNNLRLLGEENVKRFSWENTALKTLGVYKEVFHLNGKKI